jgi:hypothetical protein
MEIFSLYIIIMSSNDKDEDDYGDLDDLDDDDDVDMLELNQVLPNTGARVEMEEDAMSKAVGEKLYGPTGRGSPEMRNISPYKLSRYAGKALRNEGIKNNRHLENTKAWDTKTEQERKEEEEERQFDEAISNMYKKMKKPVARSKAKSPSQKKGGTRKRNKRSSRVSRKRRNKRSTKKRRNKRSRR